MRNTIGIVAVAAFAAGAAKPPSAASGQTGGSDVANAPQASKRLRFGPSLKSLKRFSRFCVSARGSVSLFREFRI